MPGASPAIPRSLRPYLWIAVLAFVVYGQSLTFGLTDFDDTRLVVTNHPFTGNIKNFFKAFNNNVFLIPQDIFYRPVQTLYLMLTAQAGGTDPSWFHFAGLLMHIAASGLLYAFLCMLGLSPGISFLAALAFTAHPALSQAVCWIPGAVDILTMIFVTASVIALGRFLKAPSGKGAALHLLFFGLALFTKETSVLVPSMYLLYLFFFYPGNTIRVKLKALRLLPAGWIFIVILWHYLRQDAIVAVPVKGWGGILATILPNFPAVVQYLGKIFFPFNLTPIPTLPDTAFYYGIAAIAMTGAGLYFLRPSNSKLLWFGAAWFLVFLLPGLIQVHQFRLHQFYESRLYLPMAGFLVFACAWLDGKQFSFPKIRLAAGILIAVFSFLNLRHAKVFRDRYSFFSAAVAGSPHSSQAHHNLAKYYYDSGRLAEAEAGYRKTLELNPREEDAHNSLGILYVSQKRLDEAAEEFRAEIRLNGNASHPYYNLANVFYMQGRADSARVYWETAAGINPSYLPAWRKLAGYYEEAGHAERAAYCRNMMSRLQGGVPAADERPVMPRPGSGLPSGAAGQAEALFRQGAASYAVGDIEKAEALWRKAALIDPSAVGAYNNLGISLASRGKKQEAEAEWKKALKINPSYLDSRINLLRLYLSDNRKNEAVEQITALRTMGITRKTLRERQVVLPGEYENMLQE